MSQPKAVNTAYSSAWIGFSLGENQRLAIHASELSGVGLDCPIKIFSGLPEGIVGITYYNGKIFPIIDCFNLLTKSQSNYALLIGLNKNIALDSEVAILVPSELVTFYVTNNQAPLVDHNNHSYQKFDLSNINLVQINQKKQAS